MNRLRRARQALAVVMAFFFMAAVLAPPLRAQNAARRAEDIFWLEFATGTAGGVLAGPALVAVIAKTYCQGAASPEQCRDLATLILTPAIYVTLLPLGATAGVLLAGIVNGVDGNISLATTLSFLGGLSGLGETALAILAVEVLANPRPYSPTFLPSYIVDFLQPISDFIAPAAPSIKTGFLVLLTPAMAGMFAAFGFNVGATIASEPPSPTSPTWTVPLFTVWF